MRTVFILLLITLFPAAVFGQDENRNGTQPLKSTTSPSHTLLIYYSDTSGIPELVSDKKSNTMKVTNISPDLQELFSSKKLLSVRKAFPSAAAFSWHPKGAALLNYYLLTFKGDAREVQQSLKTSRSKAMEKIDVYEEPRLLYTPNDYYTTQNGTSVPAAPALEYIRAREAWDVTKGSSSVKIGISDVNFDLSCTELITKAEIGSNVVTSSTGGHGTRVACIAAGATDNGTGLPSIGFNSRLICTSLGYNGVLEAVQKGAKVVNCSWIMAISPLNESNVHNDIIDLVTSLGVTVVAGAGNGELGDGNYAFPASCDNVISVTSVGYMYDIGHPGNYCWKDVHPGKILYPDAETHTHNDKVDICAPGYSVYSTAANGVYNLGWGSSFAAPFVSGTVALLYAVHPDITPAETDEILKCSAVPIDNIIYNQPYAGKLGAGRLDAAAAVQLAAAKKLLAKPQDIKWYGINSQNQRIEIQPAQFSNYSRVAFEVVDNLPAQTYEWQFNSYKKILSKTGNLVELPLSDLDLDADGSCQHLEVRVRRGNGCAASFYLAKIIRCPVADFTTEVAANNSCSSILVKFYNSSVDMETCLWNFGDGTTSTEINPEHLYTSPGEKTITLTVNGVVTKTSVIVIGGSIHLNGSATNFEFCENVPVSLSFSGETTCGNSFQWNFGDGTPLSTERNPSHSFAGNGPYTISLVVDNSFTLTRTITGKPSRLDIGIRPASGSCSNNKFTFSPIIARGCAVTYLWNFGNGTQYTGPYPPQVTYTQGTYTVQLTVNGVSTVSRTVKVGAPFANFSISSGTITGGEYVFTQGVPVLLTDNSVCGTSYQWTFGDGTTSNQKNPSKTYSSAGVYTIKLIINGNASYTMSRTLVISPACSSVSGTAVENITDKSAVIKWTGVSSGVTLRYRKAGSSAWTTAGTIQSPFQLNGLSPATVYEFTLTALCEINPSPVINSFTTLSACTVTTGGLNALAVFSGPSCAGSLVQFTINTVPGASYVWSGPGGFSSTLQNPVISNLSAANTGVYTCTVTTTVCNVVSGGISITIPDIPVPAGLSAGGSTDHSAFISWEAASGNFGTTIEYKKQTAATWNEITNPQPPYILSGLDPGTNYQARIRFKTGSCNGTWSQVISFQTLAGCSVPDVSTVTAISSSSAVISWPNPITNQQQYKLSVRNVSASGNFIVAANPVQGNEATLSHTLTGLLPSTNYEYRIEPLCQQLNGNIFTGGTFTTLADCVVPATSNVSDIGITSAIISWPNAISSQQQYKLSIRNITAGGSFAIVANPVSGSGSSLSYTLTGLLPSTGYEYKIEPLCQPTSGNTFISGEFTTSSPVCSSPFNVTITAAGATSVTLNWTNSEGMNTTKVEYRLTGNPDFLTAASAASGSSYVLTGLLPGNTYEYKLTPVCANNNTPPSSSGNFTTSWSACTVLPVISYCTARLSDGSNGGNYSSNMNCKWVINVPGASNVNLLFTRFDTEKTRDVVSVYKGTEELAANLIGRYSGNSVPPLLTINGSSILIKFTSNGNTITGTGWEAVYYTNLCQPLSNLTSKEKNYNNTLIVTSNEKLINNISVSPNPYIDKVTISMEYEIPQAELILQNRNGRIVYTRHYDLMEKNVTLLFGETLHPDNYTLTIRNQQEIIYHNQLMNQKGTYLGQVQINEDVAPDNGISVHPNPYVDHFTVEVKKELKTVVLLMMDIQGRVLYKKDFASMFGRTTIDLGYLLPAGTYMLVIRNNKEILFRKRMIAQK